MIQRSFEVHGVRVAACAPDGPKLPDEREAVNLIGEALQQGAKMVVVPIECLYDNFFRLRTGVAGAIAQKFVTYRVRLTILGDISHRVGASTALRDFVYECNRGEQVWFVADLEELEQRLAQR